MSKKKNHKPAAKRNAKKKRDNNQQKKQLQNKPPKYMKDVPNEGTPFNVPQKEESFVYIPDVSDDSGSFREVEDVVFTPPPSKTQKKGYATPKQVVNKGKQHLSDVAYEKKKSKRKMAQKILIIVLSLLLIITMFTSGWELVAYQNEMQKQLEQQQEQQQIALEQAQQAQAGGAQESPVTVDENGNLVYTDTGNPVEFDENDSVNLDGEATVETPPNE